ncbi:MAG: MEKHLA domain-containing protein [Cyanobacteria bacterium SW_9_44_58]|nr:MAG: MEKHLA domain-containing protein [Cyanobacteria bacterium SW_9_44_58]
MIAIPNSLTTRFYIEHGKLLLDSFYRLTGKELLADTTASHDTIIDLFYAPFALVSHGTETDPIFNFGNQAALERFKYDWDEFIQLPSRKSAEPMEQSERNVLLQKVSEQGFIDNYRGVRISSDGSRFVIENGTIWNLIDAHGRYHGQAAAFQNWYSLES